MGTIKPLHQIQFRGYRFLNDSVPSTLPWMSRSSPGIQRRAGVHATTTGHSRS
jgi:hypothetical protein